MKSTLSNTYNLLTKEKRLTIGYLGGSITYGSSAERIIENGEVVPDKKGTIKDSYANRVAFWFREQFPQAKIEVVNAGVAGTHSQLGLYRLEKTLMNNDCHAMPDLVFIEFTSNDWIYGDHTAQITKAEVESLVVNIRKLNPYADIVILASNVKDIAISETKQVHREVAEHYGLTFIDLGAVLQNLKSTDCQSAFAESAATKTLKYTVDNLHPSALGYKVYFDEIIKTLAPQLEALACEATLINRLQSHPLPLSSEIFTPKMITANNITAPENTELKELPLTVTLYGTNPEVPYNHALTDTCLILKQGEIASAVFKGGVLGILVELQSKTNIELQFSIDNGEWEAFNLDNEGLGFEKYKHTQAFMIKAGLTQGAHTVKLKSLTKTPLYLGALLAQ
ncbi:MAG: SGNH/GDSL hydrolase family protein [Clostridia bacterium]|nr:SGNH/GDSL hydrolase family protein [Clostridia bacterium]